VWNEYTILLASDSTLMGGYMMHCSKIHSHVHMQVNMKRVFALLTWQQSPSCSTWFRKFLLRSAIFTIFTAAFLAVRIKLNQGMPRFTPWAIWTWFIGSCVCTVVVPYVSRSCTTAKLFICLSHM